MAQRGISELAPLAWAGAHHIAHHFTRGVVTAAEFREYIAKKWSIRLRCDVM